MKRNSYESVDGINLTSYSYTRRFFWLKYCVLSLSLYFVEVSCSDSFLNIQMFGSALVY